MIGDYMYRAYENLWEISKKFSGIFYKAYMKFRQKFQKI